MFFRIATLTLLVFAFFPAMAQDKVRTEQRVNIAAKELQDVLTEAGTLGDKLAIVTVKAKVAALQSYSDAAPAEATFLQIWKFTNEQTDDELDKQRARLVILKQLFPRNPKLARRLLAEQPKSERSPGRSRARDDGRGLTTKLAVELIDTDPSTAAALLEKALSIAATPAEVGALSQLRAKDSLLSDYIAAKTLETLPNQPSLISLSALPLLAAYVFPGPEAPILSLEAESSLQLLQLKYFLAGYEVLQTSLKETTELLVKDHHYTQGDLQYRAANQGQVAAILAALAPRLQPSLSIGLAAIAGKLAPQVPANLSQLTRFALQRLSGNRFNSDDPEQRFLFALSNGDFDAARDELERLRNDEKKELYTQLLIKNEARAFLAKSDIMAALTDIRKLQDPNVRLVMYLDAVKAARRKRDPDLLKIVIDEARLLVPQTDRNGLHVRALLSFVVLTNDSITDDAMEFLSNAVTSINALSKTSNEADGGKSLIEAVMAELNDPNSLIDAPETEQAFSLIGLMDLDRALAQAKRIESRSLQLMARLDTIQEIIKRTSLRPKVMTKPSRT